MILFHVKIEFSFNFFFSFNNSLFSLRRKIFPAKILYV
jgi:hypothetical protein